jgi:DNA uptake protein ComE-like DNA-binding protein
MVKQLNSAQKRGLLIVLGGLILLAGWRWRAAQRDAAPDATSATADVTTPAFSKIDLNTADTTALLQVKGIGPASARRIVRYRSLIGGYSSTDQLLKVWGITPENFVRIEEQVYVDTTTAAFAALRKAKPQNGHSSYNSNYAHHNNYSNRSRREWQQYPAATSGASASAMAAGQSATQVAQEVAAAAVAPAPSRTKHQLDINTADSLDLVMISGIGAGTARNILKYRSLIYFFDTVDQLAEVWGIRPENLERMKPYLTVGESRHAMPHLKINEMTVDELGRHKYLGWKDAKIVVAYREMHGKFADMDALLKVQVVDPAKWEKLKPYLVF